MAERQRQTFRVRKIPDYIERHQLSKLLKGLLSYGGPLEGIEVFSLATSIETPSTQVATVCFDTIPTRLCGSDNEWVLYDDDPHLPHNIILDTHFLGFTVLNEVPADKHVLE